MIPSIDQGTHISKAQHCYMHSFNTFWLTIQSLRGLGTNNHHGHQPPLVATIHMVVALSLSSSAFSVAQKGKIQKYKRWQQHPQHQRIHGIAHASVTELRPIEQQYGINFNKDGSRRQKTSYYTIGEVDQLILALSFQPIARHHQNMRKEAEDDENRDIEGNADQRQEWGCRSIASQPAPKCMADMQQGACVGAQRMGLTCSLAY